MTPLLSLEVATPESKSIIDAVIHIYWYARKSASQAVLIRMQPTLYATPGTPQGASRLVLAMSAQSMKTRRAPTRRCRNARVCGYTTTTMHDNEHTPPYCGAKTIAIVGDTSWPQTAKQDGDKLSKIFLCNLLGKT